MEYRLCGESGLGCVIVPREKQPPPYGPTAYQQRNDDGIYIHVYMYILCIRVWVYRSNRNNGDEGMCRVYTWRMQTCAALLQTMCVI
jgi:hypothetical protein